VLEAVAKPEQALDMAAAAAAAWLGQRF